MPSEEEFLKILEQSGLSKSEINEKVKATITRMKGLINEQTALYIIIKELGLESEEHKQQATTDRDIMINEIKGPMENVSVVGRITDFMPPREFTRKKDNKKGSMSKFWMEDSTGQIGAILWNDRAKYVEFDGFAVGELVRIINGQVRKGLNDNLEIHVGIKSDVEINPTDVDYTKYPKQSSQQKTIKISEITKQMRTIAIEAKIMYKDEPRTITKPDKSFSIQRITVEDDSGDIPIVFWNDDLKKIDQFQRGDTIIIDKLYAKEQYNNKEKLELTFGRSSTINLSKKASPDEDLSKVVPIKDALTKDGIYTVQGEIIQVDDLKEIEFRDGSKGKLLSITLSDESDAIRITFWRDQAETNSDLKMGDKIKLTDIQTRKNNYSGRNEGTFRKNSAIDRDINIDIKTTHELPAVSKGDFKSGGFSGKYTNIKDIDSEGFFEIKGFIAKEINRITIYEACTKCRKKADNCACPNGPEKTEYRQIVNVIIDDGTETMRAAFIGENADKLLGFSAIDVKMELESDNAENFKEEISMQLMGKDMGFKGRVRMSSYSNQYEMTANSFKLIDPEQESIKLIGKIENQE